VRKEIRHPGPLARRNDLVIREVGDEVLVYDLLEHRVHCLNQHAAEVWRRCDGGTSIAEIARLMHGSSGVQASEDLVSSALDQLKMVHLLVEETSAREPGSDVSRRDAITRIALGAAVVTLPLVTSILAPTAADALSCHGHRHHDCSNKAPGRIGMQET